MCACLWVRKFTIEGELCLLTGVALAGCGRQAGGQRVAEQLADGQTRGGCGYVIAAGYNRG